LFLKGDDILSVDLELYLVEETSGIKTKIDSVLDLGSIFKGSEKKIPIAIYNNGDEPAINPKASIAEYFQDGKNFHEALTWKKVSMDKSSDFTIMVNLPTVQPKSWMQGKDVYMENFNGYSTTAGTRPDQNWTLWAGSQYVWEVYNGWLQHNIDTQHSRAMWNVLPKVKDFEYSMKVTVRDGVYAGLILRDIGDYDTGYIVLIQGQAQYFGSSIPQNHGVIQVWSGKFTSGASAWTLLYQSGSIGVRGTHDYFKVRLIGNRFDFWYQNEQSIEPLYSFVDGSNRYTNASKPIIASHPSTGSILIYFDDIKMEVPNNNGLVWIQDTINKDTKLFGRQYSVFKLEYGGE
jgi:hypothetical protein